MRSKTISSALKGIAVTSFLVSPLQSLSATNLSLGADYLIRSVSINERDNTINNNEYTDSRLQVYLTADLSKDVEASVRLQSITPWGLEGSTNPLSTRYPSANGNVWVQNAYLRLPNIWKNRITLTLGRQPIQWGDGVILADDDLGFNAVRAHVKSPFRFLPIDLDGFTAKITEGLKSPGDTDLNGLSIGFDREVFHWELMGLWEHSDSPQPYQAGASTVPISISKLDRQIFGVRVKTNVKDAYFKAEGYAQSGNIKQAATGAEDIKLGGMGYVVGLGGKANNRVVGRFGATVEYAVGDGDNPGTTNKDESFRSDFASRWSGLERKGYGKYFAGTLSDAYSPSNPFGSASTTSSGLPPGTSGIQTIKFGMDSTPSAEWTISFDYFQFKAQKVAAGSKDLGSEFDYGLEYRYSGLVTFKAYLADFRPGEAYQTTPVDTKKNARMIGLEAQIKF